MKVCLINSHSITYEGSYPIGLAIIASYLRKFNHEVKIVLREVTGLQRQINQIRLQMESIRI